MHFFLCAHCKKPVTLQGVPTLVVQECFVVFELYRAVENPFFGLTHTHPMVCSDTCYGALLRVKPPDWEIVPEPEERGELDEEEKF